MGGWFLIATRI